MLEPDARFDGGSLDCGSGLLLLIRRHIDPLLPGQLLEVRSSQPSVADDLPAWSRLTGNVIVSIAADANANRYLIQKAGTTAATVAPRHEVTPSAAAIAIRPLAVMGIGSWPRPLWLSRALHERLAGRLPENEFQRYADDAVRLAVASQERAGVDVVTDGEQRRDNYASFVGSRLDGCQLIPIIDVLPYVDDPEAFANELRSLDVPADQVRHPAVFGRIARTQSLTAPELSFMRSITPKPVKVALPGPYLLTRTMWLECVTDHAYADRESLADDVVAALRSEAIALLADGAALVQFDEPVLTEVVFGRSTNKRSFMCGALGERREAADELKFAESLLHRVLTGLPRDRVALHVCRGNWSRDESLALTGPYTPLMPLFASLPVGTLLLEMATPRAGELAPLKELPRDCRIGVGVVNPKRDAIEPFDEVMARAETAVRMFGADRVWLHPDCGFATFADNPVASAEVAEQKLRVVAEVASALRQREGV